jgi:hypothetical protein
MHRKYHPTSSLTGEKSVGLTKIDWILSCPVGGAEERRAFHSASAPNRLQLSLAFSRLSCETMYTNVLSESGGSAATEYRMPFIPSRSKIFDSSFIRATRLSRPVRSGATYVRISRTRPCPCAATGTSRPASHPAPNASAINPTVMLRLLISSPPSWR